MRFMCSKVRLLNGINKVQKAITPRPVLQVLEGVLLEAAEQLKITGNNLEIGIECFIDADIQKIGSIVINSKILGDIIRKMPDSIIQVEVQGDHSVLIECDDTRFKIKGMSADTYPTINPVKALNTFTIRQDLLKDMIRKTNFVTSTNDSLPIITGTLFEYKDGCLTLVSMDRTRMAVSKANLGNTQTHIKAVVPGKTLNDIMKILQPEENNEAVIHYTENQISFCMGDCRITSRLLEGEYFNYNAMLLKEYETQSTVETKRLLLSLERAYLLASGDNRQPVTFRIETDKMYISSQSDYGEVNDEFPIQSSGKELNAKFNPALFIDILRNIDDDQIEFLFATSSGPCTLRPVDNTKFTYVIAGILR